MALSQDEKNLVDTLKKSGKDKTEILRIIAKRRTGDVEKQPDPVKDTTLQSFGKGLVKGVGQLVKDTGDLAVTGAASIAAGPLGAIPGVGSFMRDGAETAVSALQGSVGITPENLESQNTAEMAGKGTVVAASFVTPFVASRFASLLSRAPVVAEVAPTVPEVVGGVRGAIQRGAGVVSDFVKNPKLALAKENVSPQLESSANRLFLEGTERLKDPIATYDNYVAQARRSTSDVKIDPPISVVGESIGDAFNTVITKRRNTGKIMGEELKKISNIPTNVLPTIDTYVADLAQEGLSYDRVSKKIIQNTKQSKMTSEDLSLLEKYASELQKLGSKPTVGELDAFMSRLPKEVEVYKSSKNIIGSTNAERIIKKSLADLREQFNPSLNPAFAPYYEARKEYANLSNFIDDGVGFLGKMTQSGDFAKDASLAKTSVQSILNNGKKDWLMELENLSGYPALDDSVLALQAMKDVGDFRGLSLLEKLSSETPTSAAGFTQKVIDFAMEKAGRAVGGTPEEQTRVFLQSLKEGAERQTNNAAFGAAAGIDPNNPGEVDPETAIIGAALGIFGGSKVKKEELTRFIEELRKRKQGASEITGRQLDRAIEAAQKQLNSL